MPAWAITALEQEGQPGGRHRVRRGESDDGSLLLGLIGRRGAGLSAVQALLTEGAPPARPAEELRASGRRHGCSRGQLRRLLVLRELVCRWQVRPDTSAPAVTSPRQALLLFQDLRSSPKERFAVLYLNTRNQPVGCETVAVGGLNIASLQPREIFEPALRMGAAAVILAHNHPSGDPTPSPEDLGVTRHLQEAGRLLGVEVLDHLVVCSERFKSLREAGSM
jgi:DNA repair protein RadC